MNRNHLKIIACVSMLCDHIGYLLLPEVTVLRYIGRIAFPLFAFFIGEGSRYTHNRKKYILSLLILATGCQLVYGAEELITDGALTPYSRFWFINVIFTFALASVSCYLFLDFKKEAQTRGVRAGAKKAGRLLLFLAALALFVFFAWRRRKLDGWTLCLDYGLCGILLPLSTVIFDDKRKKLFCFSLALTIYCFVYAGSSLNVWFSLLCIPLLFFYNGQSGSRRFKYFFYIFYPAHLGLLYLLSLLF